MPTIILTRPENSIRATAGVYRAAGLVVYLAPAYSIRPNPGIRADWLRAPADAWLILSVHALEGALSVLPDWQPDANTRVIAVGPAVVRAWQERFSHPVEQHPLMNSEGVIKLLEQQPPDSVKILTNRDGRGLIRHHCMQAGISYQQLHVYQRILLPVEVDQWQALYSTAEVILTATSGGILQDLVGQLDDSLKSQVLAAPLVVGAERIAEVAEGLGFTAITVADNPTDQAMCAAVRRLTSHSA
jgi:uroporphyrinogen-III synthase